MGKRRGGFVIRIIDLAVLVLTLAVVAGLIFAYMAPSVDPNRAWIFAYAGLAAPILYLVNLFLMLYWAIRWKPVFFLPALILLVGMPKVKLFYHFDRKPTEQTLRGAITVMTYNVEGFLNTDRQTGKTTSTAWQIANYIKSVDPDIVCIQEFQSTHNIPEATINQWLSDWPHHRTSNTIAENKRNVWGAAIYSKFPIVASQQVEFEGSSNGALWADVVVAKGDTVRVFSNHMETTYVKDTDLQFLQPENFAADPDKTGQIRKIAGRLRRGFRKRAHQADTLAQVIASRDIPTIVCGDFNDPPMSYVYRTIRNGFGDTFEDRGEGYGYTYKRLYRLMRIDYILRSSHFETLSYESPETDWSDHKPVIAVLRKKTD